MACANLNRTSLSESPLAQSPLAQSKLAKTLEAFFVRHRERLVWVHAAMFIGFIVLLGLPMFLADPSESDGIFDHFTRFALFAMWGLWFPLVFLSVIFSGRSWCGLFCPMGAASEWANKKGLQRTIPKWVRWEGTPIISFLIVTIWGQTVGVRDHPEAMLIVFGTTMIAAVLMGFIYGRNKRAWCRHACPIGLLLGVFSRIGAVQFAPKRKQKGGDAYTEKGICPTMIDINRKEESRHCIECFRCVHPKSKGGLLFRLRKPGEEIEQIGTHHPSLAEVWFIFLATGVSLGGFLWLVLPQFNDWRQIIGTWLIEQGQYWIGESGPMWLMSVHPERREVFNWLDFGMIVGFMSVCMLLVTAFLSLVNFMAAWLVKRQSMNSITLREAFTQLGYQFAPVAMVSLVIGLGGQLFSLLDALGLSVQMVQLIKTTSFIAGLIWSLYLGWRILGNFNLPQRTKIAASIPTVIGGLGIALAWWPAIFGV